MKLESITVRRFKSIRDLELVNCKGFNVLIGKNNAGKSNLLTAINTFFQCIKGGAAVTLTAPIRRDVDFFERATDQPIELSLTFELSLAERDALIRDIVTESPQVKNVTDGMDPDLRLLATVKISPPPSSFGYVSRLTLVPAVGIAESPSEMERLILGVSQAAASELHAQLVGAAEVARAASLFESLAENKRYFPENLFTEDKSRMTLRFLRDVFGLDVNNLSVEHRQLLESLIRSASTWDELRQALSSESKHLREQDEETRQKETLRNAVDTFGGEQRTIPTYAHNLIASLSRLHVHYLRERKKNIGIDDAKQLLALKTRRGGPEVLFALQNTVKGLLGVHVDAFEGEGQSPRLEATPEMDVDQFLVEVNGAGIREALRIVLDVEFEKPDILLVEEPEVHLHPGLEVGLMRYLKQISAKCQVFITTHSTNFVDSAEMSNIFMVSKSESTQVERLEFEEAEATLPRELGLRLSTLFMYDRLVFVEGPSDETILREFASTLSVNLSQANVGFITMGGARNLTHYAAAATLTFLAKRQVRAWFVLDRDERDEVDIAKLKSALGEGTTIYFLQRRELENYLLAPEAISKFIGLKRSLSGTSKRGQNPPTMADVAEVLNDCANQLKSEVVVRRTDRRLCHPLYPTIRNVLRGVQFNDAEQAVSEELQRLVEQLQATQRDFSGIYTEESETIERDWETSKLSLVPGDELLDMVCQHFEVRFNKDRDGARLAGLMEPKEIEEEIVKIIMNVGGAK